MNEVTNEQMKLPEPPLLVLAHVAEWYSTDGASCVAVEFNPRWCLIPHNRFEAEIVGTDYRAKFNKLTAIVHPRNDVAALDLIVETESP